MFCSLLRDALKIELQKGQIKAVKGFAKTCFSESLITEPSVADGEEAASDVPGAEKDAGAEITYHGGLGLKFKFPGDPKKCIYRLFPYYDPLTHIPITDYAKHLN